MGRFFARDVKGVQTHFKSPGVKTRHIKVDDNIEKKNRFFEKWHLTSEMLKSSVQCVWTGHLTDDFKAVRRLMRLFYLPFLY